MRKIPNSRRLAEHISRALNELRNASSSGEIIELFNRDPKSEGRSVQTKEVAERLREYLRLGVDPGCWNRSFRSCTLYSSLGGVATQLRLSFDCLH
jgi:hypothetical protein